MKSTFYSLCVVLLFSFSQVVCAQVDNSSERKNRIKDNLLFVFPQLDGRFITVQDLSETGVDGLQQGQFVIDGQQQQPFLTTADDTEFYLVAAGPFDLSKSNEELAQAQEVREEEESKRAAEVHAALLPAMAGMPSKGSDNAPITILEFSDFQCPYCANAAETIEKVFAKNSKDVRLVYAQFPLESIHPWARTASIASLCAMNQSMDAFWTLHDGYFAHQKEINADNVVEKSREYVSASGIDMATWTACTTDTNSEAYKNASGEVDRAFELGREYGVNSTPGFFVNGRYVSGAQSEEVFQSLIDKAREEQ